MKIVNIDISFFFHRTSRLERLCWKYDKLVFSKGYEWMTLPFWCLFKSYHIKVTIGDISCWECICVASLRVNHKLGKVQDGNIILIKMCTVWPFNPCAHVLLLCTSFPFTVPSPKTGAVRKYNFLITCFLLWALDVQLGNIYPSMSKVSLDVQGYIRCPRIH